MSRPMNMLRTRRKDCNVKPNRRLDRKSSRGMIYENEELRLKTININAEVESRVSDIKKLKKENEMLKKGLWYLRDEYDKLEKLIKDKKLDFSSSSTTGSTSSDSESYSSYSDDEEEVETTQNMKNVQRTNLKNLQDQFDHLSVVTEETSAENSELNSNRVSLNKENWNNSEEILKPDQSYPDFITLTKSPTLPMADNVPLNFFASIRNSVELQQVNNPNNIIYPGDFYNNQESSALLQTSGDNYISQKVMKTNANNFYQNMVLVPKVIADPEVEVKGLEKSATDLIVKIDNQNFNDKTRVFSNTPSQSTFSNGGNLEELLNDIESISQEILKISHLQKTAQHPNHSYCCPEGYDFAQTSYDKEQEDKAFKSELNVVLVPNPMPLIGVDKYKNVQKSFENLQTIQSNEVLTPLDSSEIVMPPVNITIPDVASLQNQNQESNPFFFGNFKDNYVNADHFTMRYNPELYKSDAGNTQSPVVENGFSGNVLREENQQTQELVSKSHKYGSKTNLIELTSSEHIPSENELKSSKLEKSEDKTQNKQEKSTPKVKSPKLSIRKKVSIHFKGKKEKNKLSSNSDSSTPKISNDRRGSIFDTRLNEKDKDKTKVFHQKTPSLETQKSVNESNAEPKTPSSSDSKSSEKKSDKKESGSEKKTRKSVSVSPDRKHVHVKEDGQQPKKHKKHRKSDKSRQRRQSALDQRAFRERSFSICTDRSNILEHRLGLGNVFGSSLYFDDYSERERTNSLSSCDTNEHRRKISTLPNVALNGKVPWCGCWGNGCL